jgi:hypothetical protein
MKSWAFCVRRNYSQQLISTTALNYEYDVIFNKRGNARINVTLRRVLATIITMEKQ